MDEFKPENNQENQGTESFSEELQTVENGSLNTEQYGGMGENETQEPVVELSLMQRILGILLSPGEVFRDLERRPKLLFPLLLVAFGQVIFLGARFSLYKEFMLSNMKMMMKTSPMHLSMEQMQAAVNTQATFGLIVTPIVSLVSLVIITAITMWILRLFGGKGSFKQYLCMNGYTNVISMVYLLIALILSFFTANIYMDVPYDSIATFLGPDMRGTWAFGIAKGIRVFAIWQYSALAIGLAYISKVDKRIVYGLVALGFVALVLFGGYGEAQLAKFL